MHIAGLLVLLGFPPMDENLHDNVTKVFQRFNMLEAKSVGSTFPASCRLSGKQSPKTKAEKVDMMKVPYNSVIGSLMYAMVCTRSDIGYAVEVVSRFMSNPDKEHWNAVKWILRYMKGTSNMSLILLG